jgi:hypothetical protein
MKEDHAPFAWNMLSVAASWLIPFCTVIWIALEASAGTKDDIVGGFAKGCIGKQTKAPDCDKLRTQFVEIIKEDLWTLGSSADRKFLPDILRAFTLDEVELRIAAAQAFGMIGPQDQDADTLAHLANDPVADVRHAVTNAIPQGKGKALDLLKQRVIHLRTGREVEKPADPARFSMPAAPDSAYLFDSSDATKGRLSYLARGKSDPTQFYKAKAKKGPYKWDQFKEQYRYQLRDEDEAMDQAQRAAAKQLESEPPPDPATNMEAYVQHMQKLASVSTQGSMGRTFFDNYQTNLYGTPTVYILEERQIGQRNYATRYAVVYQELAYKRPGYRLAWTTIPDDALKAAQVSSLKEQREQEAHEAASKRDEEAAKKRDAELESLTKKKDATEKKQFKKGQDDLEKSLGF